METVSQTRDDAAVRMPGYRYEEDIGRSEDGKYVSEAEYWEKYYENGDFIYEWNNGYLEEKPVSDYVTILMYRWLLRLLEHFFDVNPVAGMTLLEFGFRLPLPGKTVIRKPDFAVVRNDNPVPLLPGDRSYSGVFDLCVEALSDSSTKDVMRDTVDKKKEYRLGGVREYYILDGKGAHTAFYRRNRNGLYVEMPPRKGVIRSEVLPGFQFRISDLDTRPDPEKLAMDEVYSGFVLLSYQEAEQRADRAEKGWEGERQRADQMEKERDMERRRAERLAEMLRKAGISTDEVMWGGRNEVKPTG